jgi:hypothetical protein
MAAAGKEWSSIGNPRLDCAALADMRHGGRARCRLLPYRRTSMPDRFEPCSNRSAGRSSPLFMDIQITDIRSLVADERQALAVRRNLERPITRTYVAGRSELCPTPVAVVLITS